MSYLDDLRGLRLSAIRFAGHLLNLQFGELHASRTGRVGRFAVHVQCPWRVELDATILVGSSDVDELPDSADGWTRHSLLPGVARLIDWMGGYEPHDSTILSVGQPIRVLSARLTPCGGLSIELSGGYRFVAFPDSSDRESWRIFEPWRESAHFVVVGGSIEQGDDP